MLKKIVLGVLFIVFSTSLLEASRGLVPAKKVDYYEDDNDPHHQLVRKVDDDYTISFYLQLINTSFDEFEINKAKDSIIQLIKNDKVPTHEDLSFVYWKVTNPFTGPQFPIHHVRMRAYRDIRIYFEAAGHKYYISSDCRIS